MVQSSAGRYERFLLSGSNAFAEKLSDGKFFCPDVVRTKRTNPAEFQPETNPVSKKRLILNKKRGDFAV
jgi:hypothetical protein